MSKETEATTCTSRRASNCDKAIAVICIAYLAILALLNACFFIWTPFLSMLTSNVLLLLFLYLVVQSLRMICFHDADRVSVGLQRFCILVAISLGMGMICECCTLIGDPIGTPLFLECWSVRRVAAFACGAYCLLYLLWTRAPKFKADIILKKLPALRFIGVLALISLCASALCAFLFCRICGIAPFASCVFSGCLCFCVVLLVASAVRAWKIEAMFAIVAITAGLSLTMICPAVVGLSWDDEIHYKGALWVSYLNEPSFTYSDDLMMNHGNHPESWVYVDDAADIERYTALLDAGYDEPARDEPPTSESPYYIFSSFHNMAYIPSAIGLWVGRLLHLPFSSIVVLGRITSLLFYVIMCAAAIRIIPIKKTLLASLALFPTCIMLASSFSRDTWILSFVFLGTALFVKDLCGDGRIRCKDLAPAILAMFFAIGVKPIYFPLLGILLLFKKEKFVDVRQWHFFIGGMTIAALLLIASFALPFALGSMGQGDLRGGEGVNSNLQVAYILANPIEYAQTVARYIVGSYLNPLNSYEYTLQFGYLGILGVDRFSFLAVIPLLVVVAVALIDSNKVSMQLCSWKVRFIALLMFLFGVILVVTSLYVAFTSVGSSTVAGVQGRYLLPLLPAFLVFFFNVKVENQMNETAFHLIPVCIFGVLSFLGIWTFIVSPLTV